MHVVNVRTGICLWSMGKGQASAWSKATRWSIGEDATPFRYMMFLASCTSIPEAAGRRGRSLRRGIQRTHLQ
jgi:hypothetical protein